MLKLFALLGLLSGTWAGSQNEFLKSFSCGDDPLDSNDFPKLSANDNLGAICRNISIQLSKEIESGFKVGLFQANTVAIPQWNNVSQTKGFRTIQDDVSGQAQGLDINIASQSLTSDTVCGLQGLVAALRNDEDELVEFLLHLIKVECEDPPSNLDLALEYVTTGSQSDEARFSQRLNPGQENPLGELGIESLKVVAKSASLSSRTRMSQPVILGVVFSTAELSQNWRNYATSQSARDQLSSRFADDLGPALESNSTIIHHRYLYAMDNYENGALKTIDSNGLGLDLEATFLPSLGVNQGWETCERTFIIFLLDPWEELPDSDRSNNYITIPITRNCNDSDWNPPCEVVPDFMHMGHNALLTSGDSAMWNTSYIYHGEANGFSKMALGSEEVSHWRLMDIFADLETHEGWESCSTMSEMFKNSLNKVEGILPKMVELVESLASDLEGTTVASDFSADKSKMAELFNAIADTMKVVSDDDELSKMMYSLMMKMKHGKKMKQPKRKDWDKDWDDDEDMWDEDEHDWDMDDGWGMHNRTWGRNDTDWRYNNTGGRNESGGMDMRRRGPPNRGQGQRGRDGETEQDVDQESQGGRRNQRGNRRGNNRGDRGERGRGGPNRRGDDGERGGRRGNRDGNRRGDRPNRDRPDEDDEEEEDNEDDIDFEEEEEEQDNEVDEFGNDADELFINAFSNEIEPRGGPGDMSGQYKQRRGNMEHHSKRGMMKMSGKEKMAMMVQHLLQNSDKMAGRMGKRCLIGELGSCINKVLWNQPAEGRLCEAMDEDLRNRWKTLANDFLRMRGFSLPANNTYGWQLQKAMMKIGMKQMAIMASPLEATDIQDMLKEKSEALKEIVEMIETESQEVREANKADYSFYSILRNFIDNIGTGSVDKLKDIWTTIQGAKMMGMSRDFGSGGMIGEEPEDYQICKLFNGHGVVRTEYIEDGNQDEMKMMMAGKKRLMPVFWKVQDNRVMRGDFCVLSANWIWTPVAKCNCGWNMCPSGDRKKPWNHGM